MGQPITRPPYTIQTSKPELTGRVEPQKKLSLITVPTQQTESSETLIPNKKIAKIKAKPDLQRPQVTRTLKEKALELIDDIVSTQEDVSILKIKVAFLKQPQPQFHRDIW